MIRLPRFSPTAEYFRLVKQPGQRYLQKNPRPTAIEFSTHSYWREIHGDFYNLYNGICAYSASWTPRTVNSRSDQTSIDHFIPKSIDPRLAYEWDNFRMCRARLNQHKGDSTCVVDPFHVQIGWFRLDFDTFLIYSEDDIPSYLKSRIDETISCLRLNDTDYVNERIAVIQQYCLDKLELDDLRQRYPFIAVEIQRSKFDTLHKSRWRSYFQSHPFY